MGGIRIRIRIITIIIIIRGLNIYAHVGMNIIIYGVLNATRKYVEKR
tara:strand:- start:2533 stop:2673 length:141 start_codon:yes stop_codon:yes gene_type:complete